MAAYEEADEAQSLTGLAPKIISIEFDDAMVRTGTLEIPDASLGKQIKTPTDRIKKKARKLFEGPKQITLL